MKGLLFILLYFVLIIVFYMLFSTIGLLFGCSYKECLGSAGWGVTYFVFIGWWLALIPACEIIYDDNPFS